MVGFDVGSAFDPMSNYGVRSGVGWLDSMVADEAKIHLVVFAWNATMLQAKILKCEEKVSLLHLSKFSRLRCVCHRSNTSITTQSIQRTDAPLRV